MILEIKNLSVAFSSAAVVNGVSLEVTENSFTSLVGESGSGKSLTALSVCRLIQPRVLTGEIIFYDKKNKADLLKMSELELLDVRGKKISYVFQDPGTALNPVLTVGEQISETVLAHLGLTKDQARNKALKGLEAVRIKDAQRVYSSYPHELSGGMKQRAMIAMALVTEPQLLIADEPTTMLDAATQKEIMDLLALCQKEFKTSVLFITHDLGLAARSSEIIYVMEKGKIVERMQKEAGEFLAKTPYGQKLFRARLIGVPPKSMVEV